MWKFFLFLAFPALELYLLFKAGAAIGPLKMVLWIFGSAFFGMWIMRSHSEYSMKAMQADLAAGRMPQNTLMDGMLIFLAGVLLILPGLLTDAAGLLLLIPPVRRMAGAQLIRHFGKRGTYSSGDGTTTIFYTGTGGFRTRQDNGFAPTEEDPGPRQATVIESTAIEISVEKDSDNREKGSDSREKDGDSREKGRVPSGKED